jgi:hypothetical protein
MRLDVWQGIRLECLAKVLAQSVKIQNVVSAFSPVEILQYVRNLRSVALLLVAPRGQKLHPIWDEMQHHQCLLGISIS